MQRGRDVYSTLKENNLSQAEAFQRKAQTDIDNEIFAFSEQKVLDIQLTVVFHTENNRAHRK